jgi:hypothetical protein
MKSKWIKFLKGRYHDRFMNWYFDRFKQKEMVKFLETASPSEILDYWRFYGRTPALYPVYPSREDTGRFIKLFGIGVRWPLAGSSLYALLRFYWWRLWHAQEERTARAIYAWRKHWHADEVSITQRIEENLHFLLRSLYRASQEEKKQK